MSRKEKLKKQLNITETTSSMNKSKTNSFKSLTNLSKFAHKEAKRNGFDSSTRATGESLVLIISEIIEALEADRKGRTADIEKDEKHFIMSLQDDEFFDAFNHKVKDTYEDEISDAIIRVFDESGSKGIDLGWHVESKMRYNSLRGHKHGKKY